MTNNSPIKMWYDNQHVVLHYNYPDNCCLCKAEQRIKELELQVQKLSELIDTLTDKNTVIINKTEVKDS